MDQHLALARYQRIPVGLADVGVTGHQTGQGERECDGPSRASFGDDGVHTAKQRNHRQEQRLPLNNSPRGIVISLHTSDLEFSIVVL
jgi:hypothetical protein